MHFLTVTEHGEVEIPANFRERLGIKPNDRLLAKTVGRTLVIKTVAQHFKEMRAELAVLLTRNGTALLSDQLTAQWREGNLCHNDTE